MKKIFVITFCFLLLLTAKGKAESEEWIDYGKIEDVSLDYIWKVEFNSDVDESKIQKIELENFQGKVENDISAFENVIKVDALKPYLPGTEYVMKLYLSKDKKYKLEFLTTKNHDGEGLIHFIDLDYGRAVLFQMPNGENVLLDSGSEKDSQKLLTYLRALNISQLDMLILSDDDVEFSGGAFELMRFIPAKKIFIGNFEDRLNHIANLRNWARNKGVEIIQYSRGKVIEFGDAVLKVLSGTQKRSDNSSVFYYSHKQVQGLILGKIDDLGIDSLNQKHSFKSIELIDVMDYQLSDKKLKFIDEIGSKYAVISSNHTNELGGMDVDSIDEISRKYIAMYRPDIMGPVVLRSKGNRVTWMNEPWIPSVSRGSEWNSKLVIETINRKKDLVYIKNYGNESIDLNGWYLKSSIGGEKYVFEKGTIIKPNQRIQIQSHISRTFSKEGVLNWSNRDIWNDDKLDIGELYDARGNLISKYPYKW